MNRQEFEDRLVSISPNGEVPVRMSLRYAPSVMGIGGHGDGDSHPIVRPTFYNPPSDSRVEDILRTYDAVPSHTRAAMHHALVSIQNSFL